MPLKKNQFRYYTRESELRKDVWTLSAEVLMNCRNISPDSLKSTLSKKLYNLWKHYMFDEYCLQIIDFYGNNKPTFCRIFKYLKFPLAKGFELS